MKKFGLLVFVLTGLVVLAGGTFATASSNNAFVPGQVLVKFRDNRSAAASLRTYGLETGSPVGDTGAHLISVPTGTEEQLVAALSRNKNVEYAELDAIVQAATTDTYYPRQYALENTGQSFVTGMGVTISGGVADADVDAPEAWSITRGNGMVIAIVDSGITTDNPDISSKIVGAANFSSAATTEDNYGHGTHVAGIAAAATDNGVGVAGVCPDCSVLSAKVLNDSGYGSNSSVASGIAWAADNGADVINMSLGSARKSRTLGSAVDNAWKQGVVLVAAAGNSGNSSKLYPAAYNNVIAVAATNNSDQRASFSSYGSWVDVAAPGENVFSTFPNHPFFIATEYGRALGFDVGSGTSMASPIVAGIAALTIAAHPSASNADIRAKLAAGSDAIAGTGQYWIFGRANADGAVNSDATAQAVDSGSSNPGKSNNGKKPR